MPNIIYIDHSPKFSGAEKVLLNLLRLIKVREKGYSPVLVCQAGSDIIEYFSREGIVTETTRMRWFTRKAGFIERVSYAFSLISFSVFLLKEIKKYDARIIQANTFISALYALIPLKISGRPMVWYMYDILDQNLFNKIFIRLAGRGSDSIICASEAVKKRLVEFGVDEKKCKVIYNSILEQGQDHAAKGDFRKELGVPDGVPLVGMIGQITRWKGQSVFIESMPFIAKDFPSARFVLVGDVMNDFDREYKAEIESAVARKGLGDRVIMAGFRKDIPSVVSGLDIVIHASIKPDALPTVILEAMFMGKPVVATDVGGVPEIVDDGVSGFVVPPNDPKGLADAVCRLLGDETLRSKMGRDGKRAFLDKFKPEAYLENVMKVYRDLLNKAEGQKIFYKGAI